jgi:hypothetical protein
MDRHSAQLLASARGYDVSGQNPRMCGFFRTILRKYRIRETGVWSEVNSNCRYRFVNGQTTASG